MIETPTKPTRDEVHGNNKGNKRSVNDGNIKQDERRAICCVNKRLGLLQEIFTRLVRKSTQYRLSAFEQPVVGEEIRYQDNGMDFNLDPVEFGIWCPETWWSCR